MNLPWKNTTLFFLHHAGGAAHAYTPLIRALPAFGAVQGVDLPGHGRCASMETLATMEACVAHVTAAIAQRTTPQFALFGHSMGGLIAFATAQNLERYGQSPEFLVFSGCSVPGRISAPQAPISHLPTADFLDAVGNYGGLPEEVRCNPLFCAYFEPLLRADFRLIENYAPAPHPLEIPTIVLYGQDDTHLRDMHRWTEVCIGPLALRTLTGAHFYLLENPQHTAITLMDTLATMDLAPC